MSSANRSAVRPVARADNSSIGSTLLVAVARTNRRLQQRCELRHRFPAVRTLQNDTTIECRDCLAMGSTSNRFLEPLCVYSRLVQRNQHSISNLRVDPLFVLRDIGEDWK